MRKNMNLKVILNNLIKANLSPESGSFAGEGPRGTMRDGDRVAGVHSE